MTRRNFKFSIGGVAPIDYENLKLGIPEFVSILEAAMASCSLQISFLTRTIIERQPEYHLPKTQQPKDQTISKKKTRKPSPLARELHVKELSMIQPEGSMRANGYRVAKPVPNDKKLAESKRKTL